MTRLGRASALLAVFAGDYATLMLINGQLTDFDVSVGVCALPYSGPLFSSMSSTQLMHPLGLTSPSNIKATRYGRTRP